jgi:hypothetical protein
MLLMIILVWIALSLPISAIVGRILGAGSRPRPIHTEI